MEKIYIGVAGTSEQPSTKLINAIDGFFEKLTITNYKIVFILGGYWGFMKYFADKAVEKEYEVVFILPDNPHTLPPNNENTVIIQTDLGYPTRSTILCKTSDVLIVFGGKIGSMIEALLAYDFGKPVIILKSGYDSDKLCSAYKNYFDKRAKAPIYCVDNVEELVNILKSILDKRRLSSSII